MKYIESQEQIVTQDLKASTAVAVAMQNKAQTLDNIVNKANIKMGGLNYSVHLETKSVFFPLLLLVFENFYLNQLSAFFKM